MEASIQSTHSYFRRYGRGAYKFQPPTDPEEPQNAISRYYREDDPIEAGRAIIHHYTEACVTCQIIGQSLIDCMRDLKLDPHFTELSACIKTMGHNNNVDIRIINPETEQDPPHILTYAEHPLPENINSASHNLNIALERSFKYRNGDEHAETHHNLDEVRKHRNNGQYMKHSIKRLEDMVAFIDDLKNQCEYFIHDFISLAS